MERAGKCVVGVLERCEDTKLAISRHIPFFAPFFNCAANKLNSGEIERGKLTDDHVHVLRNLGRYEITAYEVANLMLDEQISGE